MTFNEFLKEKFSKYHPSVLDDDMPDAFQTWVDELSEEELQTYQKQFDDSAVDRWRANSGTGPWVNKG
jgi:hypothetical protein